MGMYGLISVAAAVAPLYLLSYIPGAPGLITAALADLGKKRAQETYLE